MLAFLLALAVSIGAQDSGIEALKAKQAKLKQSTATTEERSEAMRARGLELAAALEQSVADVAKEGVEFKKLSNEEAVSQFPQYEKVTGRAVDGLIVRVDNSFTHELELVAQPVGGRMFKMTWAFYKDGSYKVGENVSRGGKVFFKGANYLDSKAVIDHRKEIKDGLIKFLSSTAE